MNGCKRTLGESARVASCEHAREDGIAISLEVEKAAFRISSSESDGIPSSARAHQRDIQDFANLPLKDALLAMLLSLFLYF